VQLQRQVPHIVTHCHMAHTCMEPSCCRDGVTSAQDYLVPSAGYQPTPVDWE
jgi:hypothetical protein